MTNTYLSFKICNELYAVDVVNVLEVLEKQEVTHVPNAPNYILGIINFRGNVVPVFDTRIKFNHPERKENESFVIIVFDISNNGQSTYLGAMVDRVNDVIAIDDTDIKPVPAMSKDFNTDFLNGIVKLNDRFIMLMNTYKVFTSSEIINIQQAELSL